MSRLSRARHAAVAVLALALLVAGCGTPAIRVTDLAPTAEATSTGTPTVSPSRTPEATATATGTPTGTATPSATEAPSSTPAATPASETAPPTATAPAAPSTPAPPATPPFTVTVQPTEVGRGETLFVRVTGPSAGLVRVDGTTVPLLASGGGSWAVVGIGLYTELGPRTLTVTARDDDGAPIPGEVAASYTVVDPQRPADYLQVTEETAAILTPQAGATEADLRARQFAAFDSMPRWNGPFRNPLAAFEVTTLFGSGRSINGGPVGDFHTGEDMAVDEGAPVMAAAAGRVSWVGTMPIRGNAVIIDHGAGVLTGYHHLHDILAYVGQQVSVGQVIGHAGSTGFATGPHLHWELTVYGVNVDPATWTTRLFPR